MAVGEVSHNGLTDPNLHEPKGIAAANANEIYLSNGAGSGTWTDVSSLISIQPYLFTGTGTPEGVVTANIGSLFLRQDGGASTTLYVKESGTGNTGWVAK